MTDVATPTTERPTAEEPEWKPGRGPIDWMGGWRVCWIGSLAFIALALAIRIFQQFTAWSIGIDASSRDFGLYYRSLFIAEVVGVTVGHPDVVGLPGQARAARWCSRRPTTPRRSAGSPCSGAWSGSPA